MNEERDDEKEAWYERAFDAVYREVYPHRSDEQADEEVAFVTELLRPTRKRPVLDLCCGHGRHSAALAARGFRVIGLDLSADLVRAATRRRIVGALFLRGDMRRLPFLDASVGLVGSFFTSFGYFETEDEDEGVMREIARVLAPEGRFILDFLNADLVRADLVPESRRRQGTHDILERRRIDEGSGRVIKDVIVRTVEGREHHYQESVRLYSAADLEGLCARAGLCVDGLLGDLQGRPHSRRSSRTVIHGGRPA